MFRKYPPGKLLTRRFFHDLSNFEKRQEAEKARREKEREEEEAARKRKEEEERKIMEYFTNVSFTFLMWSL